MTLTLEDVVFLATCCKNTADHLGNLNQRPRNLDKEGGPPVALLLMSGMRKFERRRAQIGMFLEFPWEDRRIRQARRQYSDEEEGKGRGEGV